LAEAWIKIILKLQKAEGRGQIIFAACHLLFGQFGHSNNCHLFDI
jgi:hypothetical protein